MRQTQILFFVVVAISNVCLYQSVVSHDDDDETEIKQKKILKKIFLKIYMYIFINKTNCVYI